MSGLRYNSGKNTTLGQALPLDKTKLDPTLYDGTVIYNTDKQLYFSNGSVWVLVQPANSQFSFTGNNALYLNGKQELQLSVNSAVFATNAEFSYVSLNSRTANNATYAYGKQESQLSVANAVYSINSRTANNATYAYGKQESQLSVANAAYSTTANNTTYAYGKQESQLTVKTANNSNYLLGRTWASPDDIGTTAPSNGIFTNVSILNNLTVQGNTTFVNTSILTTSNTFIILNDGQTSPFNDIGVVLQRYTSASPTNYNVVMYWEESAKKFIIGKAGVNIAQNASDLTNNIVSLLSADENGIITIDGELNANVSSIKTLTVNTVVANGSIGASRQFLTSNGTGGTYWYTLDQYLPISKDNTSSIKYYLPMSNSATGNWTNAVISDARLSFTPSTGTLSANQGAFTDVLVSGDSFISKLYANGSIGGVGQVLISNGAGIYWENSLTVAPKAGYGLSSNSTHYQVNANTGIIANSYGTFVSADYIGKITSNNATYAFGKQESQLNVNSAIYATNSEFAYLADNSNHLEGYTWKAPSVIGGITANDAFFSNTTVNVAQIGTIYANGAVGTYGQILASNGSGVFWTSTLPSGIALPLNQNNTSTSTWYFPMSNSISGSWTDAAVADGSLSFVPSTGVLRIANANVAKAIIANATINTIVANGSVGIAGQVLTSNGSTAYWTGSTIMTYNLIGVANTNPDAGILRLTSSTQANDDVLFVGRGTTVVSSNSSTILFTSQDQYTGTVTSITSGNGLVGSPITTSGTLAVGAGAGISVNQDDVAVNAKDGLVANSSGLWVNNAFIKALTIISTAIDASYLNGKTEGQLNANSALYANSTIYFGGKTAGDWANTALGNTSADYTWTGRNQFNRSIFMGNNTSSYIEWNNAGIGAPTVGSSWGNGTKLALWEKTGTSDVGYGIGIESNAIWYSANSTSASHKWYANTNNIMIANTTGLYVNGTVFASVAEITTVTATNAENANNSTYANSASYVYGKQESQLSVANSVYANSASYLGVKTESQLSVANAVFATTAGSVLGTQVTGTVLNANNSTYLNTKSESQLSVATANSATFANAAMYLNGKKESQLYVANAVFATTAGSVLGGAVTGTVLNANNSTYLNTKSESQLSVANAVFANSASYLGLKSESQLYVANAVFATTAGSVLGGSVTGPVLNANAASYLGFKSESQLSVATANSATYANAAMHLNGKQESQLYVANAVFATTAGSVIGGAVTGTVLNANNATYLNTKSESQLSVANSVYANSASYLGLKQESQLSVANSVYANSASYLGLKQESQLSVANAVFAQTANNSLRLNGKQESQLSVANSAALQSATWEEPLGIGKTTANSGAFTTLNATGNVAFNSGYLNLTNTSGNRITFDNSGVGAPTVGSYSAGTKIVMYDSINATTTSYAMGIESLHIWNSAPLTGGFKWYANTNNILISNTTGLYVNGSIYGSFAGITLNANNATYLNTKSESQLSVAQAANSALLNSQNGAYYLNASNLATGTVPTARLGTGTADATTFLRGDQTYASPTITTFSNDITWNGGVNIYVTAGSTFDLSGSGEWGVWDTGNANYTIKSGYQAQVEIGRAGTRGLSVIGPTNVSGLITATGNITAYYSDRRLKTDIKPLTNALDKVMSISGVTFRSNDVAASYGYTDTKTQVGVIAQEIEEVLPEIVVSAPFDIGKDDDGNEYSISGENYKTVQYEKLVPLLIEAIKELKAEIEQLKSK